MIGGNAGAFWGLLFIRRTEYLVLRTSYSGLRSRYQVRGALYQVLRARKQSFDGRYRPEADKRSGLQSWIIVALFTSLSRGGRHRTQLTSKTKRANPAEKDHKSQSGGKRS
jgi:hypothetical protein